MGPLKFCDSYSNIQRNKYNLFLKTEGLQFLKLPKKIINQVIIIIYKPKRIIWEGELFKRKKILTYKFSNSWENTMTFEYNFDSINMYMEIMIKQMGQNIKQLMNLNKGYKGISYTNLITFL